MRIDKTFPAFSPKVSSHIVNGNLSLEVNKSVKIKLSMATMETMNERGILSLDFVDFKQWRRLSTQTVHGELVSRFRQDIIKVLTDSNTPLMWDSDFNEIYFIENEDYSIQNFQKTIFENVCSLEKEIYSDKYNSFKNHVLNNVNENEFDIHLDEQNKITLSIPNECSITVHNYIQFRETIEDFMLEYFQESMNHMEKDRSLSETDHIPLFELHKRNIEDFRNITSPKRSDLEAFLLKFFDLDQIDSDLLEEMIN